MFKVSRVLDVEEVVVREHPKGVSEQGQDLPEMPIKVDECFDGLDIGESKKVEKIRRAFAANSP